MPKAPSPPTPISPTIATILRDDPQIVQQALIKGLIHPNDCDPTCKAHIQGYTWALRLHPALPTPPALLAKVPEEDLWPLATDTAIADHLKGRLLQKGCMMDEHIIKWLRSVKRPIPRTLQETILAVSSIDGRLTDKQAAAMRLAGWLSPNIADKIVAARRSKGAKQAAITRKQQATVAAPHNTPTSITQHPKKDTLLAAIEERDTMKLQRFHFHKLSPQRLRAVLPAWLAAPAEILSFLALVPGLSGDAQCAAIEAWAQTESWRPIRRPLNPALLGSLSWQATARLLTAHFNNSLAFDPPLPPKDLTDALFRISLHDPALAARLKENSRLADWIRTLKKTARTSPHTQPPTDAESKWISILANGGTPATRRFTLSLYEAYPAWPTQRQIALANALLNLATHSLQLR